MLVLLFLCSAICIAAGAVMIAFGIPVKEFSFGDTLITGGIVAIVGGLVLAGLGIAVVHLQRIADALAARPPMRASRLPEPFEPHAAAGARAGRTPFPVRARSERHGTDAAAPEAEPADGLSIAENAPDNSAPTLRNPDEPPMISENGGAPLSPHAPSAAPSANELRGKQPHTKSPGDETEGVAHAGQGDSGRADWRSTIPPVRQPQSTFFDAMWPAEARSPKTSHEESSDLAESAQSGDAAHAPPAAPTEAGHAAESGERRTVAILKSGVVDGMAYTLYVDGSIEAELPGGKLRFASLNELRAYLEKHS